MMTTNQIGCSDIGSCEDKVTNSNLQDEKEEEKGVRDREKDDNSFDDQYIKYEKLLFIDKLSYQMIKNMTAIYMLFNNSYHGAINGTKLKYRLKRADCLVIDKITIQDKYSIVDNSLTKLNDVESKSKDRTVANQINDDDKDIDARFPSETLLVKRIFKYLRYLSFYFTFVQIMLIVTDALDVGKQIGWLDCILTGRVIWRPSAFDSVKYIAPTMVMTALVRQLSDLVRPELLFLDCCDFILSSRQRVESYQINTDFINTKNLNNNKFLSSTTTTSASSKPRNDKNNYTTNESLAYNHTFHIKTNNGIVMKLNRSIESWRFATFVINITIINGYVVVPYIIFNSLIVSAIISFSVNGEILWYKNCHSWSYELQNKTLVEPKIQSSLDIFNKGFDFTSGLTYYHAFGNIVFGCWFVAENILLIMSFSWITFIVFYDSLEQCKSLVDELTRLVSLLEETNYTDPMNTPTLITINEHQELNYKDYQMSKDADICYYHLRNFFESLRGYNEVIWRIYMYLTIQIALMLFPSLVSWILTGTPLAEFEQMGIALGLMSLAFGLLAVINRLKNKAEIIYRLIIVLAGKLPLQNDKSRFGKLLTYFKPQPLHCFRLGNNQLTLMYGIRVS